MLYHDQLGRKRLFSSVVLGTDRLLSPSLAEAHTYFVEYISKAYQALTDPISRENFEKYGHPDGRQVSFPL